MTLPNEIILCIYMFAYCLPFPSSIWGILNDRDLACLVSLCSLDDEFFWFLLGFIEVWFIHSKVHLLGCTILQVWHIHRVAEQTPQSTWRRDCSQILSPLQDSGSNESLFCSCNSAFSEMSCKWNHVRLWLASIFILFCHLSFHFLNFVF